jgi:hypothetical protein
VSFTPWPLYVQENYHIRSNVKILLFVKLAIDLSRRNNGGKERCFCTHKHVQIFVHKVCIYGLTEIRFRGSDSYTMEHERVVA